MSRFSSGRTFNFLPQTEIVETLLNSIVDLLAVSPDSEQKRKVLNAFEPFRNTIVPSALGLDEVKHQMKESGLEFNMFAALNILFNAAYDVDLNYASEAIEYHTDEYIDLIDNKRTP